MSGSEQEAATARLSLRSLWATSIGGFFSLSFLQITGLVVPLYVNSLQIGPLLIGIILAARSLASSAYAIHLGRLLDVLGVRRVLLISSSAGTALSLLYPLFENVAVLVILQLFWGLVATVCWMGSQTAISRLSRGEARAMAVFSFVTCAGTFLAPLFIGAAWDFGGAWPAFALCGFWLFGVFLSTVWLPSRRSADERPVLTLKDAVPQAKVYRAAFHLLRLPRVRFVILLTFVRIALIAVQESFYAVFLDDRGFSGTLIGILIGVGFLVSTPGALLSARAMHLFGSAERVLLLSTALAAVSLAITPALDSVSLLVLAACGFGLGQGLGFPLVISVMASAIPPQELGLSAGLRATVNRAAAVVAPLVMGAIAHWLSLATAFWVAGAMLLFVLLLGGSMHSRRIRDEIRQEQTV